MQQIFNKVLLTFVSYESDDLMTLLDHLKKGDYSKPIWVPGDIFERQVRERRISSEYALFLSESMKGWSVFSRFQKDFLFKASKDTNRSRQIPV